MATKVMIGNPRENIGTQTGIFLIQQDCTVVVIPETTATFMGRSRVQIGGIRIDQCL